jgi:LmbE family N-acetylglucosaminyl deacetylase
VTIDVVTNVFYEKYMNMLPRMIELNVRNGITGLPGGRTLVLAPHYDDDVIGAAGAMMTQLERGYRVKVVYLTDGSLGIPRIRDSAVVEKIRRSESEHALGILGVGEMSHLAIPEVRFRPSRRVLRTLEPILKEYSPEVVFIPWMFDNHVDHVETNRVLYELRSVLGNDVHIVGYEVWTPLVPTLTLDISRFASLKRRALMCFSSQLEQVDYMRTTMALSRRRALETGNRGYAESFLCLAARDYLALFERSGLASLKFI